ncbi:TetR/AcrR family transcriptional regulator [Levilactobacillus brevis]|uniref:TetR/AcrR family transcriptional regulator n=1 Tax=Levilactobacillus brevis TaxID=1580 RepID=UPI00041B5877|nr:TetR/AcrR family transcriptional regulator [Levilactobacillus brevis]ATU70199.1 TetR/AcrR family transcriptional regulator [Levilactobacillus brevis]
MKKKDMSKQLKIQDAVAEIILTEGAVSVSTTKVARRVGIAQSNVYLYFKDKQALLDSVYERETQKILATTEIASLQDQKIPLEERVRLYIQQVYDFSLANPDSLTLIQQIKFLRGQSPDLLPNELTPNNTVSQLLQAAIDEGVLKDLPVSLHMSLVFAIINRHTTNLQLGRYPVDKYSFKEIYQFIWDAMKR